MTTKPRTSFAIHRWAPLLVPLLLAAAPTSHAESSESELITWSCTGTPCPWGNPLTGQALVWPDTEGAFNNRLGYSTSKGIYLPAEVANGRTIQVLSGSATAYVGAPDESSHRAVGTISAGGSLQITGMASHEVLSVQSGSGFVYELLAATPPPEPPPPASPPPEAPPPEAPPPADPDPAPAEETPFSTFVTWTCTGTDCPWGSTLSGRALVWPAESEASNVRLGYTVSANIYLPASRANGTIVWINSGSASLYAGMPGASSHRFITTINAGEFFEVTGLLETEVLSVQSGSDFAYQIALGEPAPAPTTPPPSPPPPPPADPEPPTSEPQSSFLTWTCTGSPCPWGSSLTGVALVWPAEAGASNMRLGYTVSGNIYLPASRANGTIVWINSGSASLYAGLPGASSHRFITTINAGGNFEVSGILEGEVLSVQSGSNFTYQIALGDPNQTPSTPPPSTPPPSGEMGEIMYSVPANWHCNIPECTNPNWVAQVINWPSWSAYANNARSGQNSKTVYSDSGEVLYPYMGSWAHGCEVTALSGTVLIIEWQRGTDIWRETYLTAGQTHTISLTSPENGAMIETFDYGPAFSVSLKNCAPQPLP